MKINSKPKIIFNGDLLISNKRIIFDGLNQSFSFKNLVSYSYSKDGIIFNMKNGQTYLIRIHDAKTLKNTFDNIINKKVKLDIQKY